MVSLNPESIITKVSKFLCKGQIVNILGFVGHMVSAATIQLCSTSAKAVLWINCKMCSCVLTRLCLGIFGPKPHIIFLCYKYSLYF